MNRETMTSRQRVLAAINHEPVDRFPIDLGMHPSTGINAFAYKNLRQHLGMDTSNIEVYDPCPMLARVDMDIIERFHLDCVAFHPGFNSKANWNPRSDYNFMMPKHFHPVMQPNGDFIVTDGTSKGLKMPSNGYFFDGEGFDWWKEDGDSIMQRYLGTAERIYKETDLFTMFSGYGAYYTGDIEFACDMLVDEDAAMDKIKFLHKHNMNHIKFMIEKCGKYIQGVCLGGDLGLQNGPMIDPKLYERMIHPFMKEFCSYVKNNSDYKIFMHSCGAVREFIPYFIDEGIDVLNPIQVSAAGMEPNGIKQDFGDRIAFWGGGCDTQSILSLGTVEDVKNNVSMLCKIFKKNSGFIFNQVHNIMGDVNPEKIVAMLDTAYENSFTESD